ncbi:MAG: hypothetical protein OXG35_18270 [Acidobacteria bacterium]|nr:hypothetical protein [Acidobacteriota bacterium]
MVEAIELSLGGSSMAKIGRPPKPEDEQVTVIRHQKRHVEMLDRIIRDRAERDLRAVVTTVPEHKIPGTEITAWSSKIEEINYSSERRKLVATLIEEALSDGEFYPTKVLPKVPRGTYSDMDLLKISDWAERESMRLTESAPLPVKLALARNRLRRMERELSREEYIERVYRMAEGAPKRRERDDDEKTS